MKIEIKFNGDSSVLIGDNSSFRQELTQELSFTYPLTDLDKLHMGVCIVDEYTISLCGYNNDELLHIPTGVLHRVVNFLKKRRIDYSVESLVGGAVKDNHVELPSYLRTHQVEAIEKAIVRRRGVIKMVTGYGKTACIAQLIRRLRDGVDVLVTVHRINILHQLRREIANYLGIPEESIGLIGDGSISVSNITIASRDTLTSRINSRDDFITSYLSRVGVLLIDEAHRFANSSMSLISGWMHSTEYRIGFTATDEVENPLLLEALIGPTIMKVDTMEAIEEKVIMEPDIRFYNVPPSKFNSKVNKLINYKFTSWGPKEMGIYSLLYDEVICRSSTRNQLAAELIYEFIEEDRGPIIVFVKKVATSGGKVSHADILNACLSTYDINLPVIHGNTSTKTRLAIEQDLRNSRLPGVIATISILSEGISINSIGGLMFLQGGSAKRNSTTGKYESIEWVQGVGRALRIYEGKQKPIIYDFIDPIGIFNNQSEKRYQCAMNNYPGCVSRI